MMKMMMMKMMMMMKTFIKRYIAERTNTRQK